MRDFKLVKSFIGFSAKKDLTNLDPRYLVSLSQNVLINDGEKISIRAGYSLYGAANTALFPITSSHEWNNSSGTELPLRFADTTLEYYYSGAWRTLKTGFVSGATLNFTEWWSSAEVKDYLLFVDGTTNLYMWSGGITTFASATANTITKEGAGYWTESRFLTTGTRQVDIGGTTYTYTGGEGTTTLTGVSPDPTSAGHAVGSVIVQTVRTNADMISAAYNLNIIATLKNQVYLGNSTYRDVYVTKNTDYTSVAFSAARVPGEGAVLTLDSCPVAFGVGEKDMYISAGRNEIYQTVFTLASTLTTENLTVERLKTSPGGAALSQSAIGNAKNNLVFVSKESVIDYIGRVENIDTPQSKPLSDPIKSEVAGYSVVIPPHVKHHKSKTYIAFPSASRVLIYDHELALWQPPQVLPVQRLAIIDGDLYGHSNGQTESYKLFDGTSDNGNPIDARAYFAYRNYGDRANKKQFNEWFTEGYISSNTTLTSGVKYDFGGFTSVAEKEISGTDTDLLFAVVSDGSLGKAPFGENPIGSVVDSPSNLSKFRHIFEISKNEVDSYECQSYYGSNEVDAQWELLAQGGNVQLATADNVSIKR